LQIPRIRLPHPGTRRIVVGGQRRHDHQVGSAAQARGDLGEGQVRQEVQATGEHDRIVVGRGEVDVEAVGDREDLVGSEHVGGHRAALAEHDHRRRPGRVVRRGSRVRDRPWGAGLVQGGEGGGCADRGADPGGQQERQDDRRAEPDAAPQAPHRTPTWV
jgi:hypothetical protein